MGNKSIKKVEEGIKLILEGLKDEFGLDITDENFRETPQRVGRAYYELFKGINNNNELKNLLIKTFPSNYNGMVISKNINCFSMCPHHFLPVEYVVNVGYIPNKKTIGISKLSRVVELISKQPILQETFTENIIQFLTKELKPLGVIVQVKGRHFCMIMRGVKQPDSWTLTTSLNGAFKTDKATREEFELSIK